jgi:hypothetical protein
MFKRMRLISNKYANSFGKKIVYKKVLGPKILEKITFFTKTSKFKSPNILSYTKGTKLVSYLYAQKQIREKNYPAACGEGTNFVFSKKPKKTEKTDLAAAEG